MKNIIRVFILFSLVSSISACGLFGKKDDEAPSSEITPVDADTSADADFGDDMDAGMDSDAEAAADTGKTGAEFKEELATLKSDLSSTYKEKLSAYREYKKNDPAAKEMRSALVEMAKQAKSIRGTMVRIKMKATELDLAEAGSESATTLRADIESMMADMNSQVGEYNKLAGK